VTVKEARIVKEALPRDRKVFFYLFNVTDRIEEASS
jgi:hypothetical protein